MTPTANGGTASVQSEKNAALDARFCLRSPLAATLRPCALRLPSGNVALGRLPVAAPSHGGTWRSCLRAASISLHVTPSLTAVRQELGRIAPMTRARDGAAPSPQPPAAGAPTPSYGRTVFKQPRCGSSHAAGGRSRVVMADAMGGRHGPPSRTVPRNKGRHGPRQHDRRL